MTDQGDKGGVDEFRVKGEELLAKVKELIREGNIRRIIIDNDEGKTLIEIPMTIGVVGALLLPALAAVGAVAALVTNCTIRVERREGHAVTAAARVEGAFKVYGEGDTMVRALDDMTVAFATGRFSAIMGPSGSGKSTLLHCIAGLDDLTSGSAFIGDVRLGDLNDRDLTLLRREKVGFIFQSFNLIPTLDAAENITLPIDISGEKVDRPWFDTVVDTMSLRDRLTHRPSELSGGQVQRVAAARALVSRPEIVFADEPSGNLDSRSSDELMRFLRRAVDEFGQTIVMVTHDPKVAAYSDRVVFLADGRCIDEMEQPTAEAILDRMKALGAEVLRLALKGAMGHKARLFLMAMAIILGVAFIAGSYVFTDTLKSAFDVLFEQESNVDVVVRADVQFGFDTGRVPASLVEVVAGVAGVERVLPSVQGTAQPLDKDGDPIGGTGPPNLAFSWTEAEAELTEVVLREGRAPQGPREVAIDVFTADKYGFALGDSISILLPNTVGEFTVVGTAGYGDADNLLGATVVLFDLETAQVALNFGEEYSQLAVVASPGADPDAVRLAIEAVLPEGTEAITAAEQIDEGREGVETAVGFFNTVLLAFAGIGIFVGAFLIQNTYRIVVAQRTRELGMLRAVGATGRQVTWMVILEALVVALLASAIGVGVGVLLAIGLRALLGAAGIDFPQGALTVAPRTVIVGMVVGTVVTVLSAILPARKASKIPPVAALRELESTYYKSLRLRAAVGAGIVALGVALLLLGLYTGWGNALLITGIGAGVTFIGVSTVAPLFARQFGRVAGSPLPRVYGVVGRLARENAVRKPRRMAATASALMIGVALVTIVATIVASAKQSIEGTVRDEVIAEYQVQPASQGNPFAGGLSPEIAARLRELPEVAVASVYRIGEFREPGGEDVGTGYGPQSGINYLIGVDDGTDDVVRLAISAGDFAALSAPGTVMLHDDFAAAEGLAVGDVFPIEFPDGDLVDLDVVALFGADLFQTQVVISLDSFTTHYEWNLDQMVMVLLADGVDPEAVRPALEAVVADYPNAKLNNAEEYIDEVASQLDLLLNVLTGMLAMAIVIALLGIANTLALSIMERKREIGLLRAVGMTRRQVRRMIRWESVLIAVFGAVIGMVVGVGLGVAVVAAIGSGITLALPWANLALYLLVAALGGIVASIVPGWRGSRLDVLDAIAYE